MYQALIVEKDKSHRENLENQLRSLSNILRFDFFEDFNRAREVLQKNSIDIFLIDLSLEQSNREEGKEFFDVVQKKYPKGPMILFYDNNYQREKSFPFQQVRYINKKEQNQNIVQVIGETLRNGEQSKRHFKEKEEEQHLFLYSKIFFKVGNVFKSVSLNEILFFEADRNIIYANTGNRNYATSLQLKVLTEELYPQFLRVHKSYLVNVEHMLEFSLSTLKLRVTGDWTLPIGKTYKKKVLENLGIIR